MLKKIAYALVILLSFGFFAWATALELLLDQSSSVELLLKWIGWTGILLLGIAWVFAILIRTNTGRRSKMICIATVILGVLCLALSFFGLLVQTSDLSAAVLGIIVGAIIGTIGAIIGSFQMMAHGRGLGFLRPQTPQEEEKARATKPPFTSIQGEVIYYVVKGILYLIPILLILFGIRTTDDNMVLAIEATLGSAIIILTAGIVIFGYCIDSLLRKRGGSLSAKSTPRRREQ